MVAMERKEAKGGYITYRDPVSMEESQLEPELNKFMAHLRILQASTPSIRASAKLHFLRQHLRTIRIPYNLVLSVMDRHQLISHDDSPLLKPKQLLTVLRDIFYAANKLNFIGPQTHVGPTVTDSAPAECVNFDPEEHGGTVASLLWAIFDPNRCKLLSLLELKYTFLLLCNTNTVEEMVQQHFHLVIDHNRCVPQTRFRSLVIVLLKLLNYLDRDILYDGERVMAVVQHTFEQANCTGLAGLNDLQFYQLWQAAAAAADGPPPTEFIYYTNIIKRTRRMDTSFRHEAVNCDGSCESNTSITGMRFKCTRCAKFNLCLQCLLTTETVVGKHNPETHKMMEMENRVEGGKRSNLLAKLLKVFYFMKVKRGSEVAEEEEEQTLAQAEEKDGEGEQMDVKVTRFDVTASANNKQKLLGIIEMLTIENRLFQTNLEQIQKTCQPQTEFYCYLERHKNILTEQINQLSIYANGEDAATPMPTQKFHSTPFRANLKKINWDLMSIDTLNGSQGQSRIIRGAEMNKTYFEANRSDRTLQEVSTWLHLRESFCREMNSFQENIENAINCSVATAAPGANDPEMNSFRALLHKVRDILEDTYSDNSQLSAVTQQLETVLDRIIGDEEQKRRCEK